MKRGLFFVALSYDSEAIFLVDSKLVYFPAWELFWNFNQFLVSDILGKHIHL